jgi:Ran GTPase-activating protein 1
VPLTSARFQKIDLTYNEIKRGNVDSLCQLLSGKSKLVKVELNGNILGEDDLDRIKVAIGAIETVADAEDVLGETDEMEDPEEEEEEEEEDDDDDDDEESDTDGGDGSDTAEDESALVADVENQLKE